jgi:hypothetical protein
VTRPIEIGHHVAASRPRLNLCCCPLDLSTFRGLRRQPRRPSPRLVGPAVPSATGPFFLSFKFFHLLRNVAVAARVPSIRIPQSPT